jgi:flagellar assembly factor FliW
MQSFETANFGKLSYERDSALVFPCGLPGFEDRRLFLILNFEDSKPLVFLQSLEDPGLCFITLPILAVDPQYRLRVSSEDLARLDLPPERQPQLGRDVLCLAILSLQESGPTANLLAPVVVNVLNLKAMQIIVPESDYSHQHELSPQETAVCS